MNSDRMAALSEVDSLKYQIMNHDRTVEFEYTPVSFDDIDLTPLELEVLKRLRSIVESKGLDYVYPDYQEGDCKYFEYDWSGETELLLHEAPSCIVGHVIADMGLSIEHHNNEAAVRSIYDQLFTDYPSEERTDALLVALEVAQTYQDQGWPWGYALSRFEQTLHSKVMIREKGEA